MNLGLLHVLVGWTAMMGGAISGALIGLFFHKSEWAGGYTSFRRRLLRLGHIAFFGLGILNVLFGLTEQMIPFPAIYENIASGGFLVAVVAMPLTCFISAWKPGFRRLFPIPVVALSVSLISIILGGVSI